jgi:hypothetical protein
MRRHLRFPVAILFGGALAAQAHMPPPPPQPPPQHLPLIPPPVEHPAYAAQPLMNPPSPTVATPTAPKGGGMNEPEKTPAEVAAEEFRKKQVKGAELKKAVDKVLKGLHWYDKLADAKAAAAAAGKPVLWIQALGDVNGFT